MTNVASSTARDEIMRSTKREAPQTLVGGGASFGQQNNRTAGGYGNASLQTTASSYLLDCDGLFHARRSGLTPRSVCICSAIPWGFPQSARLVIAPNGIPAQLDFSACEGADVIIRFDDDIRYGWLAGIVHAVLKANPRRLQLWNFDCDAERATFIFLKLGARQ